MTVAMVHRSDIAVVGVKAVVAVACSVLVALVSRDSQHMQVAVVVRLMWTWSKGGQVGAAQAAQLSVRAQLRVRVRAAFELLLWVRNSALPAAGHR